MTDATKLAREALELILAKAGSHTVARHAVGNVNDPGFAGICAVAERALAALSTAPGESEGARVVLTLTDEQQRHVRELQERGAQYDGSAILGTPPAAPADDNENIEAFGKRYSFSVLPPAASAGEAGVREAMQCALDALEDGDPFGAKLILRRALAQEPSNG